MIKNVLLCYCFFFLLLNTVYAQSTIIGTTTYDVQSNNCSKDRIIAYDDGKISALWTGSTELTSSFTDRGMFYNHYDGTAWGSSPTARVESVRTGFGEIVKVGDHEVVISHYTADGVNFLLQVFGNDEVGSTTWTELGGSDDVTGLWPFAYCPDGTDDIYVVNADAQTVTQLYFSRSDDGGETWAVENLTLPYLTTTDGFPLLSAAPTGSADNYKVVAQGADVYVVFGMIQSDLVLLHSDDYGNDGSWERIDILDFPFDNFAGTVSTDIDGDGDTDTIPTNDGYHELLITDDGTVHVFSGYKRIYSDGFGVINFNHRSSGIWYWTTGMDSAELINTELDWESPDCVYSPYTGIGYIETNYRYAGVSSSPAASWDPETGRIYLLYTMKLEYTDIYDDPENFSAESFRDIFGMYSDDGGTTWSKQYNLTNTAETGRENFYVSTYNRVVDGKVHALWQEDSLPGHFTDLGGADIIHFNNIMYQAFEEDDFVAPTVTANFSYTTDLYYVTFTNLSSGATCYTWDFGDGGTSTLADPAHGYLSGGTYTVCLTAYSPYGAVTYCEDINLIESPAADFNFTGDPTVTFTDLSTNDPTSWSWNFDDGGISTEQNPTHTFTDNGLYNVCLTATNGGGSNTTCKNVGINFATTAPVADFSYSIVGLTAGFTDLSANTPTSWNWNFGDGSVASTEQNPSHTFATAGNYNVCLQVSNAGGISSECKELQVGTSIQDISNHIAIYPNPASAILILDAGKDISHAVVEVFNALGQKVDVPILYAGSTVQLIVSALSAGNYSMKITSEAERGVKTFAVE
jgi:PKD repeat protein